LVQGVQITATPKAIDVALGLLMRWAHDIVSPSEMPLFERKTESENVTGDAATRALSVAAVENDFVEGVYDKLAKVYDLIFGPTLHPGRLQAIERMNIQPGERVLEVGVGTGINLSLYPREATVTGIDFSRRCSKRRASAPRARMRRRCGCCRWMRRISDLRTTPSTSSTRRI
jgi:hypothetical protein